MYLVHIDFSLHLSLMNFEKELLDYIHKGYEHFLPHISIDCAVFGFHDNQLKILLLKSKYLDAWALPGGHIRRSEPVDTAAQRILKERTGLDDLFLKQYQTFGDPDRLKMDAIDYFEKILNTSLAPDNWLLDRTISIGYYALVEFSKVNPVPDYFTEQCLWWDIHCLPLLLFDHALMVEEALQTLRLQLNYQPIGYNLLPEKFTMPELQKLYETILDKPLDRRNFQKRMLGLGILERLEERKSVGPHRSPYFYRFEKQKYQEALTAGLSFGF